MSVLASIRRTCFPRHLCRAREQFPVAFAGAVANQPLTEMVSWRGVAKKRRKQEAGGVVNQMFAYCCGHATIVARRQPLLESIEPRPAIPSGRRFRRASAGHNLRAIR